jgi:hypothetical protein
MKKYKLKEEQAQLINILEIGIRKFYENDSMFLFSQEVMKGKDIDERAMVGCIYRYMHKELNISFYPHIDIEYNRMQRLNKYEVDKSIDLCGRCPNKEKKGGGVTCYDHAKTLREKIEKDQDKEISMRPDIIIHERNTAHNGLIVEFKKLGKDIEYDRIKVAYATCKYSPLHYIVGAVVQLYKDRAKVYIYDNGRVVDEITIVGDGGRNDFNA